MRVLQVHNRYLQPGGEDSVVEEETSLLRGHDIEVVQFQVKNPDSALSASLQLVASPWNASAQRRVAEAAHSMQPDLIHFHNTWYSLSPAAYRQRFPTVATIHNFRFTCATGQLFRQGKICHACIDGSAFNAVRFGCYHGSLASIPAATTVALHRRLGTLDKTIDQLVVATDFFRDRLVASGVDPQRISIKHNFVADPGDSWPKPSSSDYVVFVGRLDASKGVGELALAWSRISTPFRLVIVGDGDRKEVFEGVPNVELLGWQTRKRVLEIVGGSRGVVVPSLWYEGQTMVIVESLALGRPVVASSHGGIGETAAPLGEDSLVPPGDVEALASALLALVHDPQIDQRGRKARALYEARYTEASAYRELLNAYQRAEANFAAR